MQNISLWKKAWTHSKAEIEKQEEARALDEWQQPVQRLDESVEGVDSYRDRQVSHRRTRPERRQPSLNRRNTRRVDTSEEDWPANPEQEMRRFFLWRWFSKLLPEGYGTYVATGVWILINIFAAAGYDVPGFDIVQGNEGAGINLGVAIAFLRRALKGLV